jgi:hypothetical protein
MHGNITAPDVNPGQEVLLYTCCKVLVIGTLYRYTGIPGRHFGYEHSASRCLVHRQSTFSLDRSQQVYYLAWPNQLSSFVILMVYWLFLGTGWWGCGGP